MTTGKRSISLDLRQPLGPRGARRPRALGRRRHRVVLAARPGRARPRLRAPAPSCGPGLVMMSSCLFGQSGPLRALRRLRHDGRLARRLLPPHRLARPAAVRPVRCLQRLPVAALRAVRRCSPPSTTAGAPARASTSTSPRPRRACTSWRRPCSTRPSTAATMTRDGNADPAMVPHGVYPSAGDDALGGRSPAATTPTGGRSPRCSAAPTSPALTTAERRARRGRARRRSSPRGRPARSPDEAIAARDRRRRARPRRAELRRVHGRPAARPPRALGDAAPPRARHDRRRGLPRSRCRDTPADVSGVPPFLGQDTVDVLTERPRLRRRPPRRAVRRRRPRLTSARSRSVGPVGHRGRHQHRHAQQRADGRRGARTGQ